MTQIVTISAGTAALNIEALRQPRRLSVKQQVQDPEKITEKNAKRAEDANEIAGTTSAVTAIALDLNLRAAGQEPQHVPMQQVEKAYRDHEG
jgi:hypothetical protein